MIVTLSLNAQRGLEAGAIIQPQVYTQIHCNTPTDRAMKIPYSFAIGVDLGYNFSDNFGLRTGLLYTPMGERYNDVSSDPEKRIDLNLNYLQAPLYFKYNSKEDRFEKKGNAYHAMVRQAFLQIAESNPTKYHVINANQSIEAVTRDIFMVINNHFDINLVVN